MVETLTVPASARTFPAEVVEAKLREELVKGIQSVAPLKGLTLPATVAELNRFDVQLDSLGVVDLLCALEAIVGFELKDSLVRAGGYRSIDQAVAHLMPRIEAAWKKHGGKK